MYCAAVLAGERKRKERGPLPSIAVLLLSIPVLFSSSTFSHKSRVPARVAAEGCVSGTEGARGGEKKGGFFLLSSGQLGSTRPNSAQFPEMRKNGWQLPYHPLQVVAIAVFLALGFAFYVFFVPFVGKKQFEYVVVGLYTPLVVCVFCLYVWCTAMNPADPGIFKSKKELNLVGNDRHSCHKQSRVEGGSISSNNEAIATLTGDKDFENNATAGSARRNNKLEEEHTSSCYSFFGIVLFGWRPDGPCSTEKQSEQNSSEDGMFYCSLCEVEVRKYSKHCRVCDKCVDSFDHHCRWLNNCIGKRNYKLFFTLMVSALILLVLQWSVGILVLARCLIERKRFNVDIASKLGSSFSLVPFVVVVVCCTFLAMVATLPIGQLFFFHVLLIKKGISTYDYIIALREHEQEQEQEQQGIGGHQSPQMSPLSSVTGLSSTSSFNTFHRAAWCTPPRLFLEDQFDVIPPESGSSKRIDMEKHSRKKNNGTIKISPWTLARLNAEEVSKAAAQARKKSRVLQPVKRRETVLGQEKDLTFSGGPSTSGRIGSRFDSGKHVNKRSRLFAELSLEPLAKISDAVSDSSGSDLAPGISVSLAPLQLEARSAFHPSQTMGTSRITASSPDSSLGSPDLHPFRVSSSGTEETQVQTNLTSVDAAAAVSQIGMQLSRSTSDGYEASGGEDSDQLPTRIVHRSSNWSNLLFNSSRGASTDTLRSSSLMGTMHENIGRPF